MTTEIVVLAVYRKGAGFEQDEDSMHEEYFLAPCPFEDVISLLAQHKGRSMVSFELVGMTENTTVWDCDNGYTIDKNLDFSQAALTCTGLTTAYERSRHIVAIAVFK